MSLSSVTNRVSQWIEARSGASHLIREALDEPIKGGARWSYVFGSTLLVLFTLQAVTGIFLTLYYVPSADHAHASVTFIQKAVPGGALLRGLHAYGASGMVILVAAHIVQTFLFGSYKGKRELVWIVGGVLFLLTLGFAFTGYLLPWDQAAFFGTKVGTSIAGEIPVVGTITQRILLGGSDLTSLTLSRFFTLHVFLLPVSLGLLAALHVFLFRRAGAAGPYHRRDDHRVELFYPHQLFKDAVFAFLVFCVLVVLALRWPADLGPQADPTSDFLARPAWYFLPLFQLLKYFPGNLSLIPTVALPGVFFALLFLLPFYDRREERHPRSRPIAVTVLAVTLAGLAGLIALSRYQDHADLEVRAKLGKQQEEALAFMRAEFRPQEIGRSIPVNPPTVVNPAVVSSTPLKIYYANCANCHGADATGGAFGPSLVNLVRRRRLSEAYLIDWIGGHSREPSADSMPRFRQISQEEREGIAQWLIQLDKPLDQPAATADSLASGTPPAAYAANCAFCHGDDGSGNIGPSLAGITGKPRRSPAEMIELLKNPRAFGLKDPMPDSFPGLSEEEKRQIVDWLSKLQRK